MSDDLAKRLHWHHNFIGTNPWSDGYPFLKEVRDRLGAAADRIEALTAQLESTLRDRKLILEERDRTFALMLARAEKAESEWRKYEAAWMTAEGKLADAEAERDRAYASGYSDAETEISKSALGQRVSFLNAEYSNAAARIKDLNELLDEAQTEWSNYSSAWMTAEGKLADAEDFIEHLLKLLAEAASDLTAYVDAEYPTDTCAQYPDIARRHFRDMELVRRIEVALKGESHE